MRRWLRRADEERAALESRVERAETEARALKESVTELTRVIASAPALGAPGSMLPPNRRPIYAWDNPIWWFTPQSPKRRQDSYISLDDLRRAADTYDVLRSCIQHLKREVQAVPIRVVARDDKASGDAITKRIDQAQTWFSMDGGCGGVGRRRSHFEGMILEDLCVIGACAIYYEPARSGLPYQAFAIDAATIRPRVDAFGWPGPGEAAYEQWIYGVQLATFTREQVQYDGLWPVSYTPYFKSPTEWLILTITSALRADEWNRMWLTDGNTPSDLVACPKEWTPADIKEYAAYWDGLLAGNTRERQKTKFVPEGMGHGTQPTRKDQDFQEFLLWLMRRTCSMMGVQPAAIGYAGESYKVTQEAAMDQTSAFGAGSLLEFRKAVYDDMLVRLGFPDLEVQNLAAAEETPEERTERLVKACGAPFLTVNEARAEDGKEGVDGGEVLLVPNTMTPLDQVPAQAAQQLAIGEQSLLAAQTGASGTAATHSSSTSAGRPSGTNQGDVAKVGVVVEKRDRPNPSFANRAATASGCLYLLAHARAAMNGGDGQPDRIMGWRDEPLSGQGKAEAKQLAQRLADLKLSGIRTSDLLRASQTAAAIAKQQGLEAEPDPDLRPWKMGMLEGQESEKAKPLIEYYVKHAPGDTVPGGESFEQFQTRFTGALRGLMDGIEAGLGGDLLLVTHSRCLDLAAGWLEAGALDRVDPERILKDGCHPGMLLRLVPADGGWKAEPVDLAVTSEKRQATSADEALILWERKVLARLKQGKGASCEFRHEALDDHLTGFVRAGFGEAMTAEQVRAVFRAARLRVGLKCGSPWERKHAGYTWQARRLAAERQERAHEYPPG